MFADRAKIFVRSGKGGDGHVSFRRELYVPNGGPDGGDGGDGGNVVFVVDRGLNTLTDFRNIRKYKAEDGEEGRKRNCHGANGKDVVLSVPPGTVIRDFDTGKVIRRLRTSNKRRWKRRLKKYKEEYRVGNMSLEEITRSVASYRGHLAHGHTWKLRNKVMGSFVLTHAPKNENEDDI